MGNSFKSLGEAELEIMQVLWNSEQPVTSNYILKQLHGQRTWQLSTLMTSLSRLSAKEFVNCDRSMGVNLYTALISEDEYKPKAGKHFLDKVYHNSLQNMVASLYNSRMIQDSDLTELRQYLDYLEAEHEEEEK
ncbi:MAG: BlaI/MecI/CopY family transcriptional regulator [Lachnospiraceae bacterium]|nr:BlaI/MecI/CopY family transcriptional regulator [Lachnospiraceae bacterium]